MIFKKGDLVRFNCDEYRKKFGNSTYTVLSTEISDAGILIFIDRQGIERGFFEWRFELAKKEEYLK